MHINVVKFNWKFKAEIFYWKLIIVFSMTRLIRTSHYKASITKRRYMLSILFFAKSDERKRCPWYEKLCFTERNPYVTRFSLRRDRSPFVRSLTQLSHLFSILFSLPLLKVEAHYVSLRIEDWIEDYNSTKTGQEEKGQRSKFEIEVEPNSDLDPRSSSFDA